MEWDLFRLNYLKDLPSGDETDQVGAYRVGRQTPMMSTVDLIPTPASANSIKLEFVSRGVRQLDIAILVCPALHFLQYADARLKSHDAIAGNRPLIGYPSSQIPTGYPRGWQS